ncbi:MAG TPA: glycoside hydrolase family 99-like domain-containing protein [Xanthobacteraceae bacterium]|nr:glycoside hydrolase family 99-like domain-containing protein [Xanthobacteraceae bacterium]
MIAAAKRPIRLLAFYLTQFHPVPENDLWWGKGFTEWTNVTKAGPLFEGHYQPHLPTDLGFYDLRLRQSRHDQIALAKQYGVDGFCYHYYWFSGKRILYAPLDDMLADPGSDMPFCLCWANENWTRRWDGADREILLEHKHRLDDDLKFIQSVVPFFKDRRYIRLDGAPFFIVYYPPHLPDSRKSIGVWREYCRSVGIESIHVCAALTHGNQDYRQFGFDSGVEFPPHNFKAEPLREQVAFHAPFRGVVLRYQDIAGYYLAKRYANANVFRTVFPCWDNTPRRGDRGLIVLDGTPANYEHWLCEAIRHTAEDFPGSERFVFINAWNEWAEGCHLEPDCRYQRGFLEATLRAKSGRPESIGFEQGDLVSTTPPRTLYGDLAEVSRYHGYAALRNMRIWLGKHPRLQRIARHGRAALSRVSLRSSPKL